MAMGCLVFCALLLLVGVKAPGPWMAVAAISVSVACLFSTEGPYWSTVIRLAGPHAGAAGGLMNMVGNLGGAVSTAVVPLLAHLLGWFGALASASLCATLAAAIWLFIRSDTRTPVLTLAGMEATHQRG